MSTHALRPWTDLVKLHPDVEAGALTEAVFAIDLGAIAAGDPNVPVVNRDPEAFFRATYLTADLRKLLDEVLASLSGKPGYNRVLKLRVPFGGGKSHTLASLFHAARKREALDGILEAKEFARPGNVAVAVFDGEKFDARNGKTLADLPAAPGAAQAGGALGQARAWSAIPQAIGFGAQTGMFSSPGQNIQDAYMASNPPMAFTSPF